MLRKRLREARRWLHRARKRLWGTRQSLAEIDKQLRDATPEEREKLRRRKSALIDQERRRENVKDKLAKKVEFLERKRDEAPTPASGVVVPDRPWNPQRKPVAAWMVPWLEKTWDAGCHFTLISGWRSPEYSESLCYAMCGAPTCPGRCAGRSTNHSQSVAPGGAVDVDVAHASQFEATQYRIGSPLRNYLAYDPNHFSVSGR